MSGLAVLCGLCIGLVLYHHLLYPLLLRWLGAQAPVAASGDAPLDEESLPSVGIVVPCYNEAGVIRDKLLNLASLDYPLKRVRVYLICDGCRDDTAAVARATAAEPLCQDLRIEVIEHRRNRGKLARINELATRVNEELLALTDASALLSLDLLRICARHFRDPAIGAVTGRYDILESGGPGQATYWRYQSFIKAREDAMGSTLGAHGAFYIMRQRLFQPPPDDIINDDFVIPMYVIRQGYRVRYEPAILALELERLAERQEASRRRRLAVGNVQMVIHLADLLHPRHGAVAFNFFSGKTLRAFMPLFLLLSWLLSALLASGSVMWTYVFSLQSLGYLLALWHHLLPSCPDWRLLRILHYLVAGHVSGGLGLVQYFFARKRMKWR